MGIGKKKKKKQSFFSKFLFWVLTDSVIDIESVVGSPFVVFVSFFWFRDCPAILIADEEIDANCREEMEGEEEEEESKWERRHCFVS